MKKWSKTCRNFTIIVTYIPFRIYSKTAVSHVGLQLITFGTCSWDDISYTTWTFISCNSPTYCTHCLIEPRKLVNAYPSAQQTVAGTSCNAEKETQSHKCTVFSINFNCNHNCAIAKDQVPDRFVVKRILKYRMRYTMLLHFIVHCH